MATKAKVTKAANPTATKATKASRKAQQVKAQNAFEQVFGTKGQQPPAEQPTTTEPATVDQATTVQVPATTVQVPAVYAGYDFTKLPKSNQAFATAKRPVQVAPKLAGHVLALGPVAYKTRAGHTTHWWAAVQATLAANGGKATPEQLVAGGACPKFVGYCVNRKWLAAPVQPVATV